jgi:hypothetical protein
MHDMIVYVIFFYLSMAMIYQNILTVTYLHVVMQLTMQELHAIFILAIVIVVVIAFVVLPLTDV